MYIGSTSQKGVTHLIWEILDNCVDEAVAGYGDTINLNVLKDGYVNIQDHGRGMPVGLHHKWKNPDGTPMNALTGLLTKLHAGGKFGGTDNAYKCFKEGSLVNTNKGLINIEKLNEDDLVYDSHNELNSIINKFKYEYDGELNKITLENGKQLEAINGHYILIQRDDKLYWEMIENINNDDLLVELEENDNIEELKRIIPKYRIIKY